MRVSKRTFYIATDGKEFTDKAKCEQYEADGCVEFRPLEKWMGAPVPITDKWEWMLSGDGSCHYATATRVSREEAGRAPRPVWATHVIYFGK